MTLSFSRRRFISCSRLLENQVADISKRDTGAHGKSSEDVLARLALLPSFHDAVLVSVPTSLADQI